MNIESDSNDEEIPARLKRQKVLVSSTKANLKQGDGSYCSNICTTELDAWL